MADGSYGDIAQAVQSGRIFAGPGAKNDLPLLISHQNLLPLNEDQKEKMNKAKKYATEQSIKYTLMKQTLAHQQQQQKHLQRQQALMLMCRVYVGSISFELKEETIKAAFAPYGPIRSVNMSYDPILNKHKGFAFVEYELPEAAQLALEGMGGSTIGGRNIKVGRPSNMPQAQPLVEEILAEAALGNRIFLAGIHPDIGDDDLRSVFEAFGKVVSVQLARATPTSRHKGYGYIEYENTQSAQDAIASMNMFDLGGVLLRVGKAIMPPNTTIQSMALAPGGLPTASAVAAAAVTAKLQALEAVSNSSPVIQRSTPPPPSLGITIPPPGFAVAPPPPIGIVIPQKLSGMRSDENGNSTDKKTTESKVSVTPALDEELPQTLHHQENVVIKGSSARHLIMQKLVRPKEGSVVVLRNMVTPEEIDDSLKAEIEEECSRYGSVKHVVIYKERDSDEPGAPERVKIFVEFVESDGADKARSGMNGRYFAGRIVRADLYDRDLFELVNPFDMSIAVPLISHLRILSQSADIRADLLGCSKYQADDEEPSEGGLSACWKKPYLFHDKLLSHLDLQHLELLCSSNILEWRWALQGRLQIILCSLEFVEIPFSQNVGRDENRVVFNKILRDHKHRQPICAAISDHLIAVAFPSTELAALQLQDPQNKSTVSHYKRRTHTRGDYEGSMTFSPTGDHLLFGYTPLHIPGRSWLPQAMQPKNWTLDLYTVNLRDTVPLRRTHRVDGHHSCRILELKSNFESCLVMEQGVSTHTLTVQCHQFNSKKTPASTSISIETSGVSVLSSCFSLETGSVAFGLDDFTVMFLNVGSRHMERRLSDIRPDFVRWSPDGILLAVMSFEGSIQFFDCATYPVPGTLVNDHSPGSTVRLRSCFNSITPIAKCLFVRFPTNQMEPNHSCFSSAIVLHFERRSLSLLYFAGSSRSSQLNTLVDYRIKSEGISSLEAVIHILTKFVITDMSSATATASALLNACLTFYSADAAKVTGIVRNLLAVLDHGHKMSQDPELLGCFQVVLRRYFWFLVRQEALDEAFTLATVSRSAFLYKALVKAAKRLQKPQLLANCEAALKQVSGKLIGTHT